MFRWLKRLCLLIAIAGLLALNVLTLTSQLAFSALSKALDAIPGLHTNASRMAGQRAAVESKVRRQTAAVRSMGQSSLRRAKRLAAYQVIEVGSSYIPFLGTAVIVGGTFWELQQLCAGATELRSMFEELEMDELGDSSLVDAICATKLPSFWATRESGFFPNGVSTSWKNVGFTDVEALMEEMPNLEELKKH